mgnify:CR=1 FL=1
MLIIGNWINAIMKITKKDWKDILIDVLALQEFAKEFWGKEILQPDDFGMDLYEWQYYLGRLVTSKDPKKEIKYYAGTIKKTK